MTINDFDSDTVIKLGYTEGSGFLYCGRIADVGVETLDQICKRAAQRAVDDTKRRIEKVLKDKKDKGEEEKISEELAEKLKRAETYLQEYVPLPEREIYDCYPSITEDATILLYKGMEIGHMNPHMVHEDNKPIHVNDADGAYRLLGAIFKGIYDDLRKAYVGMFQSVGKPKETAEFRNDAMQTAERKEEECPAYLVRVAREKAADWLVRDMYIDKKIAANCIKNLEIPTGDFEKRERMMPKQIKRLPLGTVVYVMKPMEKEYFDYEVAMFKGIPNKRKILRSLKPLNGEYLRLDIKHYTNTEYVPELSGGEK